MPDSGALRQARYERHKRGDHSLCKPQNCPEANGNREAEREHAVFQVEMQAADGGAVDRALAEGAARERGEEPPPPWELGVQGAVRRVLETVEFSEGDPRVVLCATALVLAEAIDTHGANLPRLSEELSRVLTQVTEIPEDRAGKVDELRALHASRKVPNLIEWAQGQAGIDDAG